jgi:hypothetical protein
MICSGVAPAVPAALRGVAPPEECVHDIERAAELSVGRAVGFAALAIGTAMLGFAFEPALSFLIGSAGALLTAVVLELKARLAPHRPYRRTEVWAMLQPRPAWSAEVAQRIVAATLATTFRRYARLAFATALALWVTSLLLRLIS